MEKFKFTPDKIYNCDETGITIVPKNGHFPHTKNLEVINYAKDHSVVLLCFPAHCTHKLQALDVAFMNPLSTYYSKEINVWLRGHPGRVVSQFVIAELFGNAFIKAATMSKAINGFRRTGVCPFNPDVFTDDDFAPAETTDIQDQNMSQQIQKNRHLMIMLEVTRAKFKQYHWNLRLNLLSLTHLP
nr:unnamed protein product [Callosobruchus chinensis]